MLNDYNIILFDGICNFCNSSINFVIDHDKKDIFRFAALQSDPGIELQKKLGIDPNKIDSVVLVQGNRHYHKSTAALRIGKALGFPWSLIYIFIVIPPFIRNIFYDIIAHYRYKWFGKRDACRMPTPEERTKFL
jgi:predicted DCC family thiol-disulfide oxidoreductase YuxK